MNRDELDSLSEKVIGAFFEVSNGPGAGFLEKVYEKALLLVELKCVERLAAEHSAQCMNYLRASGIGVCLLVNFQKPRVDWRRIVVEF